MAAAPGLVMAGSSLYSAIKGSRRSGAEQGALAGQQQAQGDLLGQGRALFGQGMPAATSALSYYSTLLGGNRAAQAQAVAAPTANITDLYRGAERNVERQGIRGGSRDLAMAELGRDRTSQLAQLTTGVQPMAAGALGGLGMGMLGAGQQATQGAAGVAGQVMGQQFQNRQNTNQMFGQAGSDMGSAIFDVWKSKQGKKA